MHADIAGMLENLLRRATSLLPRKGRAVIEYYPGIPYRRLSLDELASLLGVSRSYVSELHEELVSNIVARSSVVSIEGNRVVVEDLHEALEIISILRENMFTVKAVVEYSEAVDRARIKELASDYVELVYLVEESIRDGMRLNNKIIRLWIKLATALELLSGRISEETAHILHVPFTPYVMRRGEEARQA